MPTYNRGSFMQQTNLYINEQKSEVIAKNLIKISFHSLVDTQ